MFLPPSAFAAARPPARAFAYLPPGAAALARVGLRGCRWPLGEPTAEGFRFCGDAAVPGRSYCAVHARASAQGARAAGARG